MPRFYFDLYNGLGLTKDEEGQAAPDEGAARDLAIESIRSLLGDEVQGGELDLRGRVEIKRDTGEVVMQVRFDEAVSVRLPEESRHH
ncbi:hypothetical protein CKY28_04240 [Sphingomonas lenta]|uniref:DUF6894 domain-containing protein n=2 Tax=Sphingomonas lenta TaxID=1141887 RepID=A0A2A2SHA5_9SPHN|nr:hypothetical protein CKY28_04240 [Sphingomonas lenta]